MLAGNLSRETEAIELGILTRETGPVNWSQKAPEVRTDDCRLLLCTVARKGEGE